MKCMIVEDELPAVKVLENYISSFRDLEIVGVYNNAMDALSALQKTQVDILFLDIGIPKISGIQLLHALTTKPLIILTTAHREFALDGYDLEVTDYLLKPISFERFARSIARVYKSLEKPIEIPNKNSESVMFSEPFIYVKTEREYVKVLLNELLYIESIKNHVKLVTTRGTHITLQGISEIENKLPGGFLRVHRSYIISTASISKFTNAYAQIQDKTIPIGKYYKMKFLSWVNRNMV